MWQCPHLSVYGTNRALAWRGGGALLPPSWSRIGRERKGGMGRPCRWGLLARGPFFLSLLGGVWLDGLWHQPQELGEYLPIHIPAHFQSQQPHPWGLTLLLLLWFPLPPQAPSVLTNLIPEPH